MATSLKTQAIATESPAGQRRACGSGSRAVTTCSHFGARPVANAKLRIRSTPSPSDWSFCEICRSGLDPFVVG